MNHYICEDCGQKYCGWAEGKFCQKCGGILREITREEFYPEEEGVAIKVDTKEIKGIKKGRKTIEPCGTIWDTKNIFRFKSKNIGVFPKGGEKG